MDTPLASDATTVEVPTGAPSRSRAELIEAVTEGGAIEPPSFDPADPDTWPAVLNVDNVAAAFRFESPNVGTRRGRVYDLVREGRLRPIGGVPDGKLTKRLRFSGMRVRELVEAGDDS